jgi:hypothetical protein
MMRPKRSLMRLGLTVAALALLQAGAKAQSTPYYITDGDNQVMYTVQNGVLINTTPTFSIAYPIAVRDTIWLGDRDNRSGAEYTLNGTPTGNTSVGNGQFSQILDGTTDGTSNYGSTFSSDVVLKANGDWSNSSLLFALPTDSSGITYDPTDNTLYVALYDNTIHHYSLSGTDLGSFANPNGGFLAGLAYEASTDSLWAYENGLHFGTTGNLFQFTKTGSLLNSLFVSGLANAINPLGGEMAVPEPGSLALLGLGAGALLLRRLRRPHA